MSIHAQARKTCFLCKGTGFTYLDVSVPDAEKQGARFRVVDRYESQPCVCTGDRSEPVLVETEEFLTLRQLRARLRRRASAEQAEMDQLEVQMAKLRAKIHRTA